MKFKRKCPCVFSADQAILRFVDIVTKEGAVPPNGFGMANPEEWAKLNCPQCHGSGAIEEEVDLSNTREVDALISDFRKKLMVK